MPGPPLTDQQFEEVFGNQDSADVIRDSAFLAHTRDQDGLGVFSLYGATANSADGIVFEQPVNCIYEHGMDGAISGSQCGPAVSLDKPGIALSSSCANPDVTMFSAWAINPEVELYELIFSDGSNALLEPNRGYVIWAWRNTKQLADIRVDHASPEVQSAVRDYVNTAPRGCSNKPSPTRGCVISGHVPIGPKPMARLNASTRPCSTNGPTPPSGPVTTNVKGS
jgi:hypothetical protein